MDYFGSLGVLQCKSTADISGRCLFESRTRRNGAGQLAWREVLSPYLLRGHQEPYHIDKCLELSRDSADMGA